MDLSRVEHIIRSLGARTEVKHGKIRCNCLLAPWTHPRGRDQKPSMVILNGKHGDPIYTCLGCHETGTLRDLLCFLWMKTGVSTFRHIEVLDGEAEKVPEGIDPVMRQARRRVSNVSLDDVHRKFITKMVKEKDEDAVPWHDGNSLKKAGEVPEIPWVEYEPYAGSIPRYAFSRGLTVETCREWELGHDRLMKRLLFPMRDRQGRLVAISGRIYVDDCPRCGVKYVQVEGGTKPMTGEPAIREVCPSCNQEPPPKYLHSQGFVRNLHLYGEHRVLDGRERVYVVEGHIDVLKLWQAGYRPVVALLGSYPGQSQVEKLVAYYDRVIVVPDADKAGDEMASLLEAAVAWRIPVVVRRPPEKKDPGEMTVQELRDLLGEPPSISS
jgi:5S rRNA maturation endonuclease (ribonuclease M5)